MAASAQEKCLVTGGLGYIASHTLVQLLDQGYACHVVDNKVNSSTVSLDRVKEITGKADQVTYSILDVTDSVALDATFKEHGPFQHVLHFASLKAVGESVAQPLRYYQNNVVGSLELVSAMQRHGVRNIIFSSSATVYGTSASPLTEESQVGVGITNPYGQSKFMIENILRDCSAAPASEHSGQPLRVVLLRYFNPVGAHPSGQIGEDPSGPPNNLSPYILQVAIGKRPHVNVFGDSYETADGTGERDYLHVMDLADGHVAALKWLKKQSVQEEGLCEVFNLGTGRPVSVLQAIAAVSTACGKDIPYKIEGPRQGDLACVYADPAKAKAVLGWEAQRTFEDACVDGWAWQSSNPNGFKTE